MKRIQPSGTLSFAAAVVLYVVLQCLAYSQDVATGFMEGWNYDERACDTCQVDVHEAEPERQPPG